MCWPTLGSQQALEALIILISGCVCKGSEVEGLIEKTEVFQSCLKNGVNLGERSGSLDLREERGNCLGTAPGEGEFETMGLGGHSLISGHDLALSMESCRPSLGSADHILPISMQA